MSYFDTTTDALFIQHESQSSTYTPITFNAFSSQGVSIKGTTNNPLFNISFPIFLYVTGIKRLPKPDNLIEFSDELKNCIIQISEEGIKLGYPSTIIDKLCCLHSIVLDELIMHSSWGQDTGWENHSLLSQLFGLRSGGELFFEITQLAFKHQDKMHDLLEVIYQYLLIGFQGRYRNQNSQQLYPIINRLEKTLVTQKESSPVEPPPALAQTTAIKHKLPSDGVNLFPVNLVIIICLGFSLFLLNYWYQESYPLRIAPLSGLNAQLAKFNMQHHDIIYNSTPEDILPKAKTLSNLNINYSAATSGSSPEKFHYWVQIATLSSHTNAENSLKAYKSSTFPLQIAPSGKYFIIYTPATSHSQAQSIQKAWKHQFGEQALIISKKTATNRKTEKP